LSIIAHGIEQGEIAARPFTPADLKRAEVTVSRPNVSVVDLSLLRRRVATQERATDESERSEAILVLLTAENELRVLDANSGWDAATPALEGEVIPPLLAALAASSDEQLLFVTSRYRFLLVDGRQLLDMAAVGQTLPELYHFGPREKLFAVARWSHLKQHEKLLLATSLGFVRAFPMDVLVNAIEAPVPLTFERPLPGWPVAACGANQGEQVILVTEHGRAVRFPLDEIPAIGLQALNRADDDTVLAPLVTASEAELLLLTDRGYGRRLPANAVFRAEKANSHGRVVLSRAPVRVAAALPPHGRPAVLTTNGLARVEAAAIPLEAESTRSQRLLRLDEDEEVRGVLLGDGEWDSM
jgi:DNA gyrase/topoisomerase IV subunit A